MLITSCSTPTQEKAHDKCYWGFSFTTRCPESAMRTSKVSRIEQSGHDRSPRSPIVQRKKRIDGFLPDRICTDQIFNFQQILEHVHMFCRPTISVFFNLKAAFNSAVRAILWHCLSLRRNSFHFSSFFMFEQWKSDSCLRRSVTWVYQEKRYSSGLPPFTFSLQLSHQSAYLDSPILMWE